jgi:hypothetical protein
MPSPHGVSACAPTCQTVKLTEKGKVVRRMIADESIFYQKLIPFPIHPFGNLIVPLKSYSHIEIYILAGLTAPFPHPRDFLQ